MLLNSKLVLKLFKPSPSNHLCSCSPCGPLSPHPLPFTLPRCQLTKRARPLRAALVGRLHLQPPPPGLKVAFDRRAVTSFGAPAQLQSPVEVSQRPAPSTRALTYSIKAQWISAIPAPLFFFSKYFDASTASIRGTFLSLALFCSNTGLKFSVPSSASQAQRTSAPQEKTAFIPLTGHKQNKTLVIRKHRGASELSQYAKTLATKT